MRRLGGYFARRLDVALLTIALMLASCWISTVVLHAERFKEQARAPQPDDGYLNARLAQ
jgi:hypothetical protein